MAQWYGRMVGTAVAPSQWYMYIGNGCFTNNEVMTVMVLISMKSVAQCKDAGSNGRHYNGCHTNNGVMNEIVLINVEVISIRMLGWWQQ